MKLITLSDIHVYETLQGSWRAYVRKEHPAYGLIHGVWGYNKDWAIRLIAIEIAKTEWPFDFSE